MFVLWMIVFCVCFALALMSTVDKTGWTEGARVASMGLFYSASLFAAIMLVRNW